MKKQLFSFLMVLALVVLAGTSAMAQAGLTPAVTYEVPMGSTATFTVNDNTANSSYTWDVFELAAGHTIGAAAGTSVVGTGATHKVSLTAPTSYTTNATFYKAPEAGNVFVVQVTETETAAGTCATIRRFYVSIFDYDVQVVALGWSQTAPADWTAAVTAQADCNSWSNTVVSNVWNSTTAAQAFAHVDSVNNLTNNTRKYTDTYFAIRISSTKNNLNEYRSRIQWSSPARADMSLYMIEALNATTGPKFGAEAGTANWTAATVNASLTVPNDFIADDYSTAQTLYFPKAATAVNQIVEVFRVRTHNMLGAADMVYDIKVDRIQLEKDDSGGAYNNGQKVNTNTLASTAGLSRLDGDKDISQTTTIRQSPATQIIGVTD